MLCQRVRPPRAACERRRVDTPGRSSVGSSSAATQAGAVRPDGANIKLGFYRGGKPQTVSVTLGKTKAELGPWEEEGRAFRGGLKDLQQQLRDLHLDDTVRDQMRILRESLGNIKIDQKEVQEDIRRGMDQARRTIHEALRRVTNTDSSLSPIRKVLENLAHSGVIVDDKADVVVAEFRQEREKPRQVR